MPNPYKDDENPWGQPQPPQTPQWGAGAGTGSNEAVQQGNAAYAAGQRGADPSRTPGYENMGAWRQWYGQQQGGNRPEDMDRFSNETLAGWDQWLQKSGENAGKYRSMRGAEGYFDKPTECPPGMVPSGPNENDPCVLSSSMAGPGGQWGGGGGGAGGGGGRGGFGGGSAWDNPIFQYLRQSGLDAAKDPEAALKVYMGQGGSAGWQQQMDAARARAMALPAGPARDAAIAGLEKYRMEGLRGMRQSSAAAARGDLQGMLQPEQGYAQLGENARQANMQNALGWGGLNLQGELGRGQLGLASQAQSWQQGTYFPWQQQEANANRNYERWALQQQLKANQPSTWQKIMGGAGSLVGLAGGIIGLSDIAAKENILPEQGALSALEHLPIYSYNYKGSDPADRRLGVMAQDVETQVSPHLVKDAGNGYKGVDLYGLLTVTIGAVKDLSKKVDKLKRSH